MKKFSTPLIFFVFCSSSVFAWDRFETVDEFSGEKTVGYVQTSTNTSGGFLVMSCNKKIQFEWDLVGNYVVSLFTQSNAASAAQAPSAAAAGEGDTILTKTGDDPIQRDKWVFDNSNQTFSPQNTPKFLLQIKGKSVLKIKNEQQKITGVFDISELNQITANVKSSCHKE